MAGESIPGHVRGSQRTGRNPSISESLTGILRLFRDGNHSFHSLCRALLQLLVGSGIYIVKNVVV